LEESESSAVNALLKSDRMALESLAAVLRLQEGENGLEELFEDHLLDIKYKASKSRKREKGQKNLIVRS
jgi:hypothetical protein